jgi:predicted CXXCH cytochrome family protein
MNSRAPHGLTRSADLAVGSKPDAGALGCLALAIIALFPGHLFGQNPHSLVTSKHNLSVGGPGEIRSSTESDLCLFCHAPHNRSGPAPLWNHQMSAEAYTPYSSSTLKAVVGQPTGASKLCLSCHDGTVALGTVISRAASIPMRGGLTTLPPGPSRIGTDLSGHHPVSFRYDPALVAAQGELRDPSTLVQEVRLDRNGELQCTACHDPHNDQYGKFLVKDNTASSLCLDCHTPNQWAASVHATSPAAWNGNSQNPWPHTTGSTVAANACENCHRPHDAGTKARLLNFPTEEQNCYSCHSGTVAAKDVASEFLKTSLHPITLTSQVHDPKEDAINPPRHVECVDCHNPHAANSAAAVVPAASGSLAGVRGVNSSGAVVQPVQSEYELCFRCHADSVNRGPARVPRQFVETNTRHEFDPASASFHPVVAVGKNASVPSLIPPWSPASQMYCTDCHNNDQGPGAGGVGPKGPHGSSYTPILERQLLLTDYSLESFDNYALCYKCHSRTLVTSDSTSSWAYHQKHVVADQTACTTCHDPHGAAATPHLINFNTVYVTPSSNGRLEYVSTGPSSGNCSLTCHGTDHDATPYGTGPASLTRRPNQLLKSPSRR